MPCDSKASSSSHAISTRRTSEVQVSTLGLVQGIPMASVIAGRPHRLDGDRGTRRLLHGVNSLYQHWRRRNPRNLRSSLVQGPHYLLELLNEMAGDTRLRECTGLSRELFNRFVRAVETSADVSCGPLVTTQEACAIFLAIMHQRLSNRQAQERFQHSGSTITNAFRDVLNAVCGLRDTFSRSK